MTGPGLAALPEGGRVDFDALRAERLDRLLGEMEAADLDVLVLGRPANITFATGTRQLWTAGSRPFSPACFVIGAERRIHMLATWDEGVPEEIPREHLFGLSWNPATAAERVRAVAGLADAGRIGSDGTGVGYRRLLSAIAPAAELVDGRAAVQAARARKSPDELAAIEVACALAEAGLDAMEAELRPGATTRQLLAVHAERMGHLGAPVIPDEAVAHATADGFGLVVDDRPLPDGALVALSPSAGYAGYEATIARTVPVDSAPTGAQAELGRRCGAALDAVIDACRPGATGATLLDTWAAHGGDELRVPLAHGLGLGTEQPFIGMGVGRRSVLGPGMVLAVQAWLEEPGVGGWLERDVVTVTDQGPRVLTRWARP